MFTLANSVNGIAVKGEDFKSVLLEYANARKAISPFPVEFIGMVVDTLREAADTLERA